jgi:hypothetical protein
VKRILLYLCILSLLLANTPKDWLHWDHPLEECEAHALELCEEADDTGHCSHEAHFSNIPHSCLLLHLSSGYAGVEINNLLTLFFSDDLLRIAELPQITACRTKKIPDSRGPPQALCSIDLPVV